MPWNRIRFDNGGHSLGGQIVDYPIMTALSASLLGGAFAKKLGDIEVHKVGVVEDYRFD
jgi:hypothetical protein